MRGATGCRSFQMPTFLLLAALLAPFPLGAVSGTVPGASASSLGAPDRKAPADGEGPTIRQVRASPPVARPGETVSLAAEITDPSGVLAAWVLVEGPEVDLNITLVPFGETWYLNRSWEAPGGYLFHIGAEDGAGNVSMATGSFQVQGSLMDTFAAVLVIGTLLVAGAAGVIFLVLQRGRA